MQSEQLINTLIAQTQDLIVQAKLLRTQDPALLTWRSNTTSWNILECLEHLNRYGDFYLPQFEEKIEKSKKKSDPIFKSGFLGNYFANSMLPKGKLNKMKTFKDKDPIHVRMDETVITTFIEQQQRLLKILEAANQVSLNSVKISTSISTLIKLKLGDAFRFYINHMVRHAKQIDNIAERMQAVHP